MFRFYFFRSRTLRDCEVYFILAHIISETSCVYSSLVKEKALWWSLSYFLLSALCLLSFKFFQLIFSWIAPIPAPFLRLQTTNAMLVQWSLQVLSIMEDSPRLHPMTEQPSLLFDRGFLSPVPLRDPSYLYLADRNSVGGSPRACGF